MDPIKLLLIISQVVAITFGKHIPTKDDGKRKSYPRQMIIPNKFIPMLKESALFKSRSSSNDLSDFLKPKSHSTVTGKTRQNLMNAMGMDTEPSQQEGGMEPGGAQPGDMEGGGMPGMAAMAGNEGMGAASEGGGLEGLSKMAAGGMGGMGGMNDQMNAMNTMGGMQNSEGGENSLENQMAGNNGMNPMNNGGPEGMMADSNNLPAGDPMGSLKDMLDNQGTNAALGTNSGAFGPGGSANQNVLEMLNQIVGKEMPSDSPVDPSSKSQQMWDQMQNKLSNERAALQPYIDSADAKSQPAPAQQDAPSNPAPSNPAPSNPVPTKNSASSPFATGSSGVNNRTTAAVKQPVYNLTILSKSPGSSKKISTASQLAAAAVNNVPEHTTDTPTAKANTNIYSQTESHENAMTKTTSNPAEIDVDDDQPLPDDMVKFLKGVKFVVSQEPGNDIILGKKFTSNVSPVSTDFKEENGVMKNIVSEKQKESKTESKVNTEYKYESDEGAIVKDLKSIDLSYARNLLLRRDVKIEDFEQKKYKRAAKVLERASRKLNDPVAKKSTEIAIASILKVLALQNKKKTTPASTVNLLTSGDVKSALSEKYFEAARVLATASKKLADPVAKKSAEIGIASILKVIVLDNLSLSKKDLIPLNDYHNTPEINRKKNLIAADDVASKLTMTSNLEKNVYN